MPNAQLVCLFNILDWFIKVLLLSTFKMKTFGASSYYSRGRTADIISSYANFFAILWRISSLRNLVVNDSTYSLQSYSSQIIISNLYCRISLSAASQSISRQKQQSRNINTSWFPFLRLKAFAFYRFWKSCLGLVEDEK